MTLSDTDSIVPKIAYVGARELNALQDSRIA